MSQNKLERKLKFITQKRRFLEMYVGLPFEEFYDLDADMAGYYGALYGLQTALQAVLDVSSYIIAHDKSEDYKENKEVFLILARHKVLTKDTATAFANAIGARNILVHQYEDVDPKIIYNIIQNNLPDFDKFVFEINAYLKKQTKK